MSGKQENSLSANFGGMIFALYVWRPSTNSIVGSPIYSWNGEGGFGEPSSTSQVLSKGSIAIAGGSVAGVQDGDVLVLEVYLRHTPANTSSYTMTWYYDGTNDHDGTSNGTVSTNQASYIETDQDLTFVSDTPPEPITMTVTDAVSIEDFALIDGGTVSL
jgi:hypothetical protein